MLASSQGRRCRAADRRDAAASSGPAWRAAQPTGLGALCLVLLLSGCAHGPAGSGGGGAWTFISLALLLAAVAGYAIGRQRARASAETALRQARSEQRQWASLAGRGDAWFWQTDASQRLLSWQGPGLPPRRQCALFDDPALAAQLQGQQPFAGLRVHAATPHDGSHGWALRGVPGHDDLGRFSGYMGSAMPTDDADAAQQAAAAVSALLLQAPSPTLVALRRGDGWTVQHANAAAAALWPALAGPDAASAWPAVLAALPPAVAQTLAQWCDVHAPRAPLASAPLAVDGWTLGAFGPLADGMRGVVLAAPQPQPVFAAACATQRTASDGSAQDPSDSARGAAQQAAQDASRQAAESENFSFTVSHDLRAPIRVVEGFTRIVKEDYGRLLDRVGNDHLDRVLGAAARMNLMIDALLQLARLSQQPLARQPVNLSQLAGYVVDDLRRASPERACEVDIEPGLSTQGDPTLLRLVLENLLGNAWKYSARTQHSQIRLCAETHDGRTVYVVRDNGAGFDMRSADRLFGLFQRLHSASEFPGHGVGLASVRRIVRRHGGEIWAEAEPGKGAAFYFTLG